MKIIFITLLLIPLHFTAFAKTKHPPRVFNEPVKLDDSGRPLYNSWERQEYERSLRERQRRLPRRSITKTTKTPSATSVNEDTNTGSIASEPPTTPTSNSGQAQLPEPTQTNSSPEILIPMPPTTDPNSIEPTKIPPMPTEPTTHTTPQPQTPSQTKVKDFSF